jgi:uncharacterized membrane protein YidH (DUF202 family)
MSEEGKPEAKPEGYRAAPSDLTSVLSTLSLVRAAYSSERSLMAWIRTSVSLYTFGFSITKFTNYMEWQAEGLQYSAGPHRLGIALVCMGILVLVLGIVEHLRRLVRMRQLGLPPISRFPLAVAAAAALFVIGAVTFVGIAFRLSP